MPLHRKVIRVGRRAEHAPPSEVLSRRRSARSLRPEFGRVRLPWHGGLERLCSTSRHSRLLALLGRASERWYGGFRQDHQRGGFSCTTPPRREVETEAAVSRLNLEKGPSLRSRWAGETSLTAA